MGDLDDLSIKVKNYKCFGDLEQGFDNIKPINVIIGKNNSGKSTLIDVINFLCKNKQSDDEFINSNNKLFLDKRPEILLRKNLTYNSKVNPEPTRTRYLESGTDEIYSSPLSSKDSIFAKYLYKRDFDKKDNSSYKLKVEDSNVIDNINSNNAEVEMYADIELYKSIYKIFEKYFFRLCSDRDIIKESKNYKINIDSNGAGCTNTFYRFKNARKLPKEIISTNILNDLNRIYEPETTFNDISILENHDGLWEICLSEKRKKKIGITKSGSGLKTILLVLSYIHILPYINKIELSDIIFAFEELENNLHPSLQRNLFNYLKNVAIKNHCTLFISTHSNIAIDFFSKDENAQIVHVMHNDGISVVKEVISYKDQKEILDDLEARASDLLQSNCLIWVEGPSDRIYFNKWIELYTNGELKEGYHYQCIFYGGKLLSALSAEYPDVENNLIKILSINSKAIIMIDSDKKSIDDDINATKKRIQLETEKNGGIVWITKGREIENYIPVQSITNNAYIIDNIKLDGYEPFSDYLNNINENEYYRLYEKSKTAFASQIQTRLRYEEIKTILDLDERMLEIIKKIKEWNGITK